MSHAKHSSQFPDLVEKLHQVLLDLEKNPYPYLPNPKGCNKRASVACIIRIRPESEANLQSVVEPDSTLTSRARIDKLFAADWAKQGDPEILFIRRAARKGDRWTSQVGLPGGKRDPEDEDDRVTSVRETCEEVGFNLDTNSVAFVGKLPGRIITTEWGTVPLMVLNPFVYLVTEPQTASLRLQPNEIASAHWVPIRALLTPSLWTYERADMSDRYAKRGGWLQKHALRALLGHMLFGAIKLIPAESVYSSTVPGFLPEKRAVKRGWLDRNRISFFTADVPAQAGSEKPLLLWGLTHGMIIDLLRLLPQSDVLEFWRWPTFSALDVRLMVWLVSFRFRRRKLVGASNSVHGPFMVIEEGFASVDQGAALQQARSEPRTNTQTSENISGARQEPRATHVSQHSAVHYMLHGYFDLIQRGIYLSVALRIVIGIGALMYAARRLRR